MILKNKFFLIVVLLICSLMTGGGVMAVVLESSEFKQNDFIPAKFTCKGADVSPRLSWSNLPEGTKSLALICDDPDAPMGTWVHWVIYDIPLEETGLEEGIPPVKILKNGAKQGMTDFGRVGYGGPCPPPGPVHRYFFKLYCLGTKLNLEPGLSKEQLLKQMEGHILEKTELMGKFKR